MYQLLLVPICLQAKSTEVDFCLAIRVCATHGTTKYWPCLTSPSIRMCMHVWTLLTAFLGAFQGKWDKFSGDYLVYGTWTRILSPAPKSTQPLRELFREWKFSASTCLELPLLGWHRLLKGRIVISSEWITVHWIITTKSYWVIQQIVIHLIDRAL